MRKLKEILWVLWIFCYLLVLNDKVRNFFFIHWLLILVLTLSLSIILILFVWLKGERLLLGSEFLVGKVPKALYRYGSIGGFIAALLLTVSIFFVIPLLIINFLEKSEITLFGAELRVYTVLTISSMTVTFYGQRTVRLLNRWMIDNPSAKSRSNAEKIVSEEVLKMILFGLYFFALIISSIIKLKHLEIWGINEDSLSPILLSFTTYIALDRVISAYKKLKEV